MKKTIFISIIFIFFIICGGSKKTVNQSDSLIIVDVKANYPQKELILQDFMDVEYIALETTDEFLCQGEVLDIGKEIILVRNSQQIADGDIFIFDRKGKGLRIINRKGQGPEEYTNYSQGGVTLDEENNEIFINQGITVKVYDLYGKFLRSFPDSVGKRFLSLQNYDNNHLICRKTYLTITEKSTESHPYVIISKKDGRVVKDFRISFKRGIADYFRMYNKVSAYLPTFFNSIIPFQDSWIITEMSSDTIYRLLPDFSITAFMKRIPSIHAMDPEIFLYPVLLTSRYYFLDALKKESAPRDFPINKLMYDRTDKKIFEYTVYNGDYANKKTIDEIHPVSTNNYNIEIAFHQKIEAYELFEANEKGGLKGELKKVASSLDEDSNPVIMLAKHKK